MGVTPSAQYSITLRLEMAHGLPGLAAEVASAISAAGGSITSMEVVEADHRRVVREMVVNASSVENEDEVIAAAGAVDGVTVTSAEDLGSIAISTASPAISPGNSTAPPV